MTNKDRLTGFRAGYPEKDAMRSKASAILGDEFKSNLGCERLSNSAVSLVPPRPYKKGGRVSSPINDYSSEKKELGGHKTDLYFPRHIGANEMNRIREKPPIKRARGGPINAEQHDLLKPPSSVYEREMLGEHSSHTRPHINYESEMRGERVVRKAHGPSDGPKLRGPIQRFAAGGVAKIRHCESDKMGMPLSKAPQRKALGGLVDKVKAGFSKVDNALQRRQEKVAKWKAEHPEKASSPSSRMSSSRTETKNPYNHIGGLSMMTGIDLQKQATQASGLARINAQNEADRRKRQEEEEKRRRERRR